MPADTVTPAHSNSDSPQERYGNGYSTQLA